MTHGVLRVVIASWWVAASLGWAQPAGDRSRINPDDSTDTLRRMRLVDAYIEQNSWAEAVDLLQSTIESYPHQVIAVPETSPPRYLSIRTYCHQRIGQLPADALELYRQRVDSQAESLLKNHEETGDLAPLYRVVDEFFTSRPADRAIDRLGDWSFRKGDMEGAARWWRQLLPADGPAKGGLLYPDSKIDPARVWAKWGLAQSLMGDAEGAQVALDRLRKDFPDAHGLLAGEDDSYVRTLQKWIQDPALHAGGATTPHWTTFAGNFARNKMASQPIRFGTIQHRWTLESSPEWEEPDREIQEFNNPFPPFQQTFAPARRDGFYCHPVTLGSKVFVSNGRLVYWFDVDKPEAIYQVNLDAINERQGERGDATGYQTLTLAGRRLFIRTGNTPGFSPNGHQGGIGRSRLICFDHEARRLLWTSDVAKLDLGQQVVFEGSPVVRGDQLYIGVIRLDAMVTSYIVCLDVETGEPRWKRLVCESTNDWSRPAAPDQNLLTLAGDSLYYCTNQGAIAAVDLPTAKLRWLAEYDVESTPSLRGARPAINPCLHHQDRLFAVPSGASSLDCFDASTGQRQWSTPLPAEHLLGIAHGLVYVTGDRVYAVDEKTGRIVWYFPENQPKGAGRGVLAGDLLYWPTATEIHVLDPRTGRRAEVAVSLMEGLRAKSGNLIPGDGFALIAQNRQLLVVRPHAWLTRQREELVQAEPNSPEAHLLLASAAAVENFPKASIHFRQAIELARQLPAEQAPRFAGRVRSEWVRTTVAYVRKERDRLGRSVDPAEQTRWDDLLSAAYREAGTPAERWSIYALRRELRRDEADPRVRIMLGHELLASPGAREAMIDVGPGRQESMAEVIADHLQEEFATHGEAPFAPWDDDFAHRREEARRSVEKAIALAQEFPLARDRSDFLLTLAQETIPTSPREAIVLAYHARQGERSQRQDWIRSAVAIESSYASLGKFDESLAMLERLQREDGAEPWTSEFGTTVEAYVGARRGKLAEQRENPRPSRAKVAWSAGPGAVVRLVVGLDRPTVLGGVTVGHDGRVDYCDFLTGKTRWSSITVPRLVHDTPAGVLWGTGNQISCLDAATGNPLWRYQVHPRSNQSAWSTVESKSGDPPRGSVQPLDSTDVSGAMTLARDEGDLILLTREGWMARLNLWTGVPKWSVDLRQSGPAELRTGFWQPGLISAGDVILARTPNQLVAIDRRGKIRWHVPILGEAGTVRPVLLADQVIVAVSRTKLAALRWADGRVLWSKEISWPSWGLPVLVESEGKLAALVDCFELLGLDATSGEPHWQARLTRHPSRRTQEVFSHAGPTVVSIDPEGIEARSIVDGRSLWRAAHLNLRSVHVVGPVVFGFASSGQEGTVLLWDLDRGDLLHEAVLPGVGAVPTVEWCSKGAVVKGDQRSVGFYWE